MNAATIKGWCPGALRPMQSGDGLVVRLRLSCNEAPVALAREIADWAQSFGNGALDLSARGNLQIRGVSEATLPSLWERMAGAGLLDASPQAEAVRNVLVAPLAGFDPAALFDVRPHAQALERELATNQSLWALPGKFGFSFEAGAFPLGDASADVAFVAVDANAFAVMLGGAHALGPFPREDAVGVALKLANVFLALRRQADPPRRMRDALRGYGLAPFAEATGLAPIPAALRAAAPPRAWLGAHALAKAAFVGVAAPFGRLSAADLRALAGLALEAGASALRLTPWRAILIPGLTLPAAQNAARAAQSLDLMLDPADPRLAVAACTGAPACTSALADTRAAAARLAPLIGAGEGVALHVSGCAKGCAWPHAAKFAVVAAEDGFALISNGRADATPRARGLNLDAVEALLKESLA